MVGRSLTTPLTLALNGIQYRHDPSLFSILDATFYHRVTPQSVVAVVAVAVFHWRFSGRVSRDGGLAGIVGRLRGLFRADRVAAVVFCLGVLSAPPAVVAARPNAGGLFLDPTGQFETIQIGLTPLYAVSRVGGVPGLLAAATVLPTAIGEVVYAFSASPFGFERYMMWWVLAVEVVLWAGIGGLVSTAVHRLRGRVGTSDGRTVSE